MPIRRVPLQRSDRDRRPALVLEDAGALAQDLDRADARAGGAEDVSLEDRFGGRSRISVCDLGDEPRHVDSCGAGDGARRWSVRSAALEAAVCFDDRLGRLERRPQLVELELRLGGCAHAASLCGRRAVAIRARPQDGRGKVLTPLAASSGRCSRAGEGPSRRSASARPMMTGKGTTNVSGQARFGRLCTA
jgi:hypothetical protein